MDDKVRLTDQNNNLAERLKDAGAETEVVRDAKSDLQTKLERSEKDLTAAKRENEVLDSSSLQLQARCNTLESDLQELRDNPRIPLEYKQEVEATTSELEAQIARLEEDLARMQIEKIALEAANANAQDDTALLRDEVEVAQEKISEAEARADRALEKAAEERSQRHQLEEENAQLQEQLAQKPKEVMKEVTRTVYLPSPAKAAQQTSEEKPQAKSAPAKKAPPPGVSDEYLLELFDEIDVDMTGFTPRLVLADEVSALIGRDEDIAELVDLLNSLEAVVVERDDFKLMLAQWRGVLLPEAPRAEGPMSDSSLLALFDKLDALQDSTGFVPLEDLKSVLEVKAQEDPSLESLIALVECEDGDIVEREVFVELLERRHQAPIKGKTAPGKGKTAPGKGKTAPGKGKTAPVEKKATKGNVGSNGLSTEDLLAIFDDVDTEGVGFAQRLELRYRVEELPDTARLVTLLNNSEGIIVERGDFEAMIAKA
jgi:hypothetical protein